MIRRAEVQFGFSIAGAAFLLMLFTPNIMWTRNQPPGNTELAEHENRILLTLERVGQVAVTCASIVFVSPKGFSMPWLLWLVAALVLMVLYEAAWIRYFKGGKELINMYAPLGCIPLPLATLPVAAFILLGIWCQSPIAVLAAVIHGIGHMHTSWPCARAVPFCQGLTASCGRGGSMRRHVGRPSAVVGKSEEHRSFYRQRA